MNGVLLMSEMEKESVLSASNTGVAESELSAGTMLRRAREAAGLHIGALAVMIKIPVKKLEALESDRLDELPDVVFVRALASSVCRTLHLDPGPILERLPLGKTPQLQGDERGLNAPFRGAGEVRRLNLQPYLTNPTVLVVGLLLIAALGIYLFPEIRPMDLAVESAPTSKEPVPEIAGASVLVGAAAAVDTPASATSPVAAVSAPSALTAVSSPAVVVGDTAAAAVGLASKPTVPVASSVQSSASAVSSDSVLVFKARGTTWVKVVDAKFAVLMSKTLVAGEQVGVSGALPLSVVIGRSDLTDVLVRGQPYAVQDASKDNVARFEVK